jgi:hypothetical protein
MAGLDGFTGAGIDHREGADAFGPRSATPYLTAEHPGGTQRYVSLVVLGAGREAGSDDVTG